MSQIQNIKLLYDVGDAERASTQLQQALNASSNAIADMALKSVQFNENGRVMSATMEHIDSSGRKVTRTFQNVGNTIQETNVKVQENIKLQRELANAAQSTAIASSARRIFPVPDNASIASLQQYSSNIIRVQQAAIQAGASAAQVDALMKQAAASPRDFAANLANVPPNVRNLHNEIIRLTQATERARVTGEQAGRIIGVSFTSAANAITLFLIRRGIGTLINSFQSGIQESVRFSIALQQAANIANQTGSEYERFANQIRQVSEEHALSISQVASAAQQSITGQFGDSQRGFEVLNQAARLSTATGLELSQTTQLLTTTLQAYNLGAEQAGNVTNTLFLAAQRTNVPLEQMVSTIGRAGILGQQLGLNFQEIIAIFLTLQQQGRNASEAMSLMQQVFNRLLNPTTQLQNVIRGLGAPTIQIAIQQRGWMGVMQELTRVAEETPERLTELAGSLRSLNAIFGTTGPNIERFNQNLDSLRNNTTAVSDAVDQTQSRTGQQIARIGTRIRNVFVEDIGGGITSSANQIQNSLGGVERVFNSLTGIVRVGLNAWIAYNVATLITVSRNAALNISFRAMIPTMAGVRAGVISLATSLRTLIASLGTTALFIGVVAGVTLIQESVRQAVEDVNQRFRGLNEQLDRDHERLVNQIRARGEEQIRGLEQEVTTAFQPLVNASTNLVQLTEINRDEVLSNHRQMINAFRTEAQTFLGTIRESISNFRSSIRQADTDIQTSLRRIASFQEQTQRSLFQLSLGFEEDPSRQLNLVRQRRLELETEIAQLFSAGDRASIEGARTRLQELRGLIQTEARASFDIQRELVPPTLEVDQFGRTRLVHRVNLNNATQQTIRLQELEVDLEQRLIQLNQQQRQESEQAMRQQQEELRRMELAIRDLTEFRVFGSNNQLLEQFRRIEITQGREAALAGARAEFERLASNAVGAATGNVERQLQLHQFIQNLRQGFEQQINAQQQVNQAQLFSEQTQQIRQVHLQRMRAIIEERNAAEIGLNQQVTQAQQNINNLRAAFSSASLISGLGAIPGFRLSEEIRTWSPLIRDTLTELQNAFQRFRNQSTEANRVLVEGALQNTRDSIQGLATASGASLETINALVTINGQTVSQTLSSIQDQIGFADRFGRDIANSNQELENAQSGLAGVAGQLGNINPQLLQAMNNGVNGSNQLVVNFENANNQLQNIINNMNTLASRLSNLPPINIQGNNLPPLNPQDQAAINAFLGNIPGRATGGPVNWGPSGTDQVLARVTRGEFIVNPLSSKRFYTQLMDINKGMTPRFAKGGSVNVGDINVFMTSTGKSDTDVRELAYKINREVRRGTIPKPF